MICRSGNGRMRKELQKGCLACVGGGEGNSSSGGALRPPCTPPPLLPESYSSISSPELDSCQISSSTPPLTCPPSLGSLGSASYEVLPRCRQLWRGPPPLRLTASRILLLADLGLAKVGVSTVRAISHGVFAPETAPDHTPLSWAAVVPRHVLLGTPTAPRVGPFALGLDVAPPAAVPTPHIRAYLLVRLVLVSA